MKFTTITSFAAALLLLSCDNNKSGEAKITKDAAQAVSVEPKKEEVSAPVDSATAMKNMMAYMTPGEQHKMLAKSAGNWVTEVSYWMAPGAPAQTSHGSTVNKMVMGGRYLEMNSHGDMMGMPFDGQGITGYDNAKKMYVSTWIDNMGSGVMNMSGNWDDATKSLIMTGSAIDPSTMKETNYREVFRMVDDNNQVMEMWGPGPDGKEMKMMEIKYKRKK